jgi:acyl carrier protein
MNEKKSYNREDVALAISQALAILKFQWEPGTDPEHTHLFDDLGLDSLDGFDLVMILEEEFATDGREQDFSRTFTIRSVIETVCRLLEDDGRFVHA